MDPKRAEPAGVTDPDDEDTAPSHRHRPASELRLPTTSSEWAAVPALPDRGDDVRAALWDLVHFFLFALPPETARDVDRSFVLLEENELLDLVQAVHDALDATNRPRFVTACNVSLERVQASHRFILHRLVPVTSRADVATIERAAATCNARRATEVAAHLDEAIARLADRPEPGSRAAIQAAIRAAESAAFILTDERYLSLDETLEHLESDGHIDVALKGAYGGLFAYAGDRRKVSRDDARLIVVMCAGFVSHLAARWRS